MKKKAAFLGLTLALALPAAAFGHDYRHSHRADKTWHHASHQASRHFDRHATRHFDRHFDRHGATHAASRGDRHDRQSGQHESESQSFSAHSHVTCEMVRSYVAQVGLEQARAVALAAGMTPAEERRARHCLAGKA
jgi:hypothetical protein